MARGRPWTKQEDAQLRRIARLNKDESLVRRNPCLTGVRTPLHPPYLLAFAELHGRTYAAVRQRASRLGIRNTLEPQRPDPIVTRGKPIGGFLPTRRELIAFVRGAKR